MRMVWCTVAAAVFLVISPRSSNAETREQWLKEASEELDIALGIRQIQGTAKNVIMFLGDGMGVSTVTAGRIYRGQLENRSGEENLLEFEKFPYVALSKTYNDDQQTPDSAGTATAYLCGVKANAGTLGVDSSVPRYNCTAQLQESSWLTSILHWSLEAGKSVGLVTTARITHATPGAAYAKSADRNWEDNSNTPSPCVDIARQLIEDNPNIHVIMGGGRRHFLPVSTPPGQRTDNRNLIETWRNGKSRASYVQTKAEFDQVDPLQTDYLLGLFTASHMAYEIERDPQKEPSLAEMTDKAIKILRKNPKGYFLLVEGGRIDHGHHDNWAKRALHDVTSFEDAVKRSLTLTREQETLMVLTADHSHVFNIAGYQKRGNDILGLIYPIRNNTTPVDKMPYTTLVYGNGPGFGRENLTNVDTTALNYRQTSALNKEFETHGGEDVAIYARGPWSHLFHGVHEQHFIAHVMAYSSCVGQYKHCPRPTPPENNCVGSAGICQANLAFIVFFLGIISFGVLTL